MEKPAFLLPLLVFVLSATLALSYNPSLEHGKYESQRQMPSQQVEGWMNKCDRRYGRGDVLYSESERGQRDNPFLFRDEDFKTPLKTAEGTLRVLDRFPELFRRISKKYRVAIFEANPMTMFGPSHNDAEVLLYVIEGCATITFLRNGEKESYNIRKGDIIRVRAGWAFYILNSDNNNKFRSVQLFETSAVPGRFEPFFGVGGENPESFLVQFSKETLQASFNVQSELVNRVFGEGQGFLQSVHDQERAKEVAQEAFYSHGGRRPFGRRSRAPLNVFNQRPIFANQHGHLRLVDASRFQQLRDLDIAVSQALIRRGSIQMPHYNSRAFMVVFVVDGKGQYELVSPPVRDQSHQQQSVSYQKFSGRLEPGNVILVPTGTPVSFRAERDQDLHVFCFYINAENNLIQLLEGQDDLWNELSDAEKELIFKRPREAVDRVLNSQSNTFFVEAPRGQQEKEEGGRDVE